MRTEPAAGSDPTPADRGALPAAEDEPRAWGDTGEGNDSRLSEDVPPHYR